MKNFFLLTLILISSMKPALSQSNGETGIPFITNWSPKDYNAHTQNWKILQDSRGVMYFANGSGVLEYDGVNWRLIWLPNDSWALSLAINEDGQIYVGAENELGYLSPDSIGQLQYVSLMPYVPEQYHDFGEVWETLATSHGIYFRSPKYLFLWKNSPAKENGDFQIWKAEHSFNRSFLVRDKLYILQQEIGLMELENDSLQLIPGGERFFQDRIFALLPFDNNRILICTRSQGQFIYDGQTFQPFITQADSFLQENQLYNGAMLADGTFALATLRGGLAIMDKHGRLLQIVNKISGLIDDNIWFLYPDREGALWLALNNGISRVETTNPLSLYSEQLGIKGLVSAVLRHQNRLYAATSQGVFFLSSHTGKLPTFYPVSGISAAAWSFLSVNNTLLAATHQGILRIEGDRATHQLCDLSSYCFYRSRLDTNLVYVGLDEGLGLLQWQNGNWFFSGPVQGISGDVRSIVEDEDGILWLGTSQQGVLRVKFLSRQPGVPTEKVPTVEIERFTEEKGIPIGSVRVSFIKNRVRIATYGMRRFEPLSKSFIPDSTFGKIFADTSSWMNRIIEGYQRQVFIRLEFDGKMMIGEATPQENGIYAWNTNPFARIFDNVSINSIYPDPEYPGVTWFGGEGIIVRYDPSVIKNYLSDYSALIRRVTVKDSVIFSGAYKNEKEYLPFPKLDYSNNNLRFEFAAAYYDGQNAIQYQVFLEGFDKTWSEWTNETKKDYTNLSEGEYHFRVRAKNLYNHLSSEAVFSFKILPPWWFTWWAYSIYIALFLFGIYITDRIMRRRVINREQEKAKIREAEIIKKQAEELETVDKLVRVINNAEDIDTLFNSLLEQTVSFIPKAEKAAVFLLDHNQNLFYIAFTLGYKKEDLKSIFFKPEELKRRYTENSDEIEKGIYIISNTKNLFGDERMLGISKAKSMLIMAVEWDNRLESYVVFDSFADKNAFDSSTARILNRFREHAISAISKAQSLKILQDKNEEIIRTQEQLVTQQKLASLGALTAGIAHEIKNPLNFINNFAEVNNELLDEMKTELQNNNVKEAIVIAEDLKQNLDRINHHGKRADSIVKGMLLHSRGSSGEKVLTNINELLDQYVALAYHGLRAQDKEFNITIEKDYDETLEKINVVPQDISRVFLNLVNNACYAANEKKKYSDDHFVPKLKISTKNLHEKVEIRIKDNGNGIPQSIRKNIFNPFFTTKPAGEGTGLGLSISHDIVTKVHGGLIKFEVEEGKYTEFIIILPKL